MRVLGIHGISNFREFEDLAANWWHHDSAAVLVEDGRIVAAIEEERLNRVKHSSFFPARAIRRCLEEAGVGWEGVDRIAVDCGEEWLDQDTVSEFLDDPTLPVLTGRGRMAWLFRREFGVDVSDRLRLCPHHLAHLHSAFHPSGFDRGLVVSIDGAGEGLCGMAAVCHGDGMTVLRKYPVAKSLGFFYQQSIALLGYGRFDEYKVMGLAPYGDPGALEEMFRATYRLLPDGDYELESPATLAGLAARWGLLRHARRKGDPFAQVHKDFAAGLQGALEDIVLHVLRHLREETGERKLCLAGGVAHNCAVNGKVLYSGLFDEVFVQPAAHDSGNALGAALAALGAEGARPLPGGMRHAYLGSDIGGEREVLRELRAWEPLLSFERPESICDATARLLADGAVVGWVQGRSEFGPRALGNRSILADPRPAENRERINAMVKKRESYRPFAPSVREERVGDYFVVPPGRTGFPFMIFVLQVREEARDTLGAVTHVDGTARVQTVSRDTNPRYWELIRAFEEITGVPILLNTSFNNHAEPIVDSVRDAIGCFLTTGIDYLVVGDYLVRKHAVEPSDSRWRALVPVLPDSRKLVLRAGPGHGEGNARVHAVESTANRYFGARGIGISAELFDVLLAADGARTLDELCADAGIRDPAILRSITEEVVALWGERAVALGAPRPVPVRGRDLLPVPAAAAAE